jgi:hypothetical protein
LATICNKSVTPIEANPWRIRENYTLSFKVLTSNETRNSLRSA